ncbi:MAG: DUF2273 domain-containing protein [Clostridia bacterium]|nr:DUF2273 domain-containing protein [Clostridia bacterium]
MNENNDNKLNLFINQYGGAIIGGLIALILCFTELYKLLVYVVIVLAGAFLGNYVQKNKTNVKEKLKEFIDKF